MERAYLKNRTEKHFNITATCIPSRHYMVDISGKIDRIISELIENDFYTSARKWQTDFGSRAVRNRVQPRPQRGIQLDT